ncbi:AAA family ATPase [Anaerococcus sp.]|uniref:AAA family ATPase n=1 Tax=Anaerococcus sp. TaxID=1872515 RepID=UPI002589B8D5|nr:AAA family ATPase [Anaerococcus sp.]MDU3211734.1 AAA family ATPase [Anaerococcus sp.]
MKPIKLEFRGFITYKEKIEIDFTKLYHKKIFIISGDTGSGKTSLFDAISFALYGKTSRDIPMEKLRSDFLTPEDYYTYVKFYFEVYGKYYEIERIPTQIARKSKSNQKISHSASLYDTSNEKTLIAEKINDVEKEIKNIVGLDKDQFTKVMLLAQGEFQQFLNASSKERTELLGKIFRTDKYKTIQEIIKEKSLDSKKELKYIDKNLENEINKDEEINEAIDSGEKINHEFKIIKEKIGKINNNYKNNLKEKQSSYKYTNKSYTALIEQKEKCKSINTNIIKFQKVREDLIELEKEEDYYIDLKEKKDKANFAKNIEFIENNLDRNKLDLQESNKLLESSRKLLKEIEDDILKSYKDYSLVDEKSLKLDELKIYKTKINESINKLDQFKQKEKEYFQIERYLQQAEKIDREIEILKEYLENNRKNLYEVNNNIDDKRNTILSTEKELSSLLDRQREINMEIDNFEKNEKLREKINNNDTIIAKKKREESKLLVKIDLYEQNKRIIAINNLIDELNETGKCPICGDTHEYHFEKIEINDIDIKKVNNNLTEINKEITKLRTQNQLYKESISKTRYIKEIITDKTSLKIKISDINKEKESLEKSLIELEKLSTSKKENLNKTSYEIQKNQNKLIDLKEKTKDSENIINYYQSNKDGMKNLNFDKLNKDLEELDKKIMSLDTEIKKIIKGHNDLLNQQTKIKTEISNYKKNIIKTCENIEYLKVDLEKKINEKFTSYDEYRSYLDIYMEIKSKDQLINSYFNKLNELRITYKNLEQYEDKKLVDLEHIDSQIKVKSDSIKLLNEEISNIKVKIISINEIFANIENLNYRYEKLSDDSVILDKLSEIANGAIGKVAGRQKVDFQTFVLSYYFDRILNYANKRLLQMSNGQFSMERSSEGKNLKSQSGLDIEILDANTGKTRPASTLSGGESFLASLSLALGLSDEISAENGGITIDTIFIDEGFGTLSDEYLAKVIEQMERLSYDNKFVGLISHVSELKEAIDGKILVKYSQDKGSNIEVIA